MFVLANIVSAVAAVLDTVLTLYFWVVIVACVLSWVNPDPYNPIVRTLRAITEPVFYFIRKHLPFTYINGFDLSPIVVILAIKFLDILLVRTLTQWALRLQA
ncbi:MAG: YggT family protein [Desulfovibrio sp.]|nr:YggT family protein [Desulfovibrio sp.]